MEKLKVMSIFGTRPEAIKMAPVVLELQRQPEIESLVAVTAQHREMLDQVLKLFDIRPNFDLNIMSEGQTLFDITSRALSGLDGVLSQAQPDVVLVQRRSRGHLRLTIIKLKSGTWRPVFARATSFRRTPKK